jgi:transcription-repair coupling factor (superfamily II helicase)
MVRGIPTVGKKMRPFDLLKTKLNQPTHDVTFYNATFDASVFLALEAYKASQKTHIIVTANLYQAQKAYDSLQQALGEDLVWFYPADELTTTELLAASNEFKIARIETTTKLLEDRPIIVVTNLSGFLRKVRPRELWQERILTIQQDSKTSRAELESLLFELGYTREHVVETQGHYAVRGFVMDLYGIGMNNPVRIEFFDDEIESIKTFDLLTQLSIESVSSVRIIPFHEALFSSTDIEQVIKALSVPPMNNKKEGVIEQLTSSPHTLDLNRYISLIEHKSILDFTQNYHVVIIDKNRVNDVYMNMINDVNDWFINKNQYQNVSFEFFNYFEMMMVSSSHLTQTLRHKPVEESLELIDLGSLEVLDYVNQYQLFLRDIQTPNQTVILQEDKGFYSLLDDADIHYQIISTLDELVPGSIHISKEVSGLSFRLVEGLWVVHATKVFQQRQVKKARYKMEDATPVRATSDLQIGDYVVHYEYGIGQYDGITTLDLDGFKNDYILIKYRNDEKLYVPIENVHLIQKYQSAAGVTPKLHSIGGGVWAKTKRQVKEKLKDIADRLIAIYAQRQQIPGFAFAKDDPDQAKFEALFEHQETPDQLKAIEEVKFDMEQPHPMDRLLCGDVGYGKTEVALRAAFKAVYSGKQVAYMCPTTILSQQHYKTFMSRCHEFGIEVALLNRFVSAKEQKQVIQDVATGKVDIVIGTHRLLSKDISFHDLGLLIVDEEQRFGVMHKERIKEMAAQVDVLTMTATPIPRTLQMALTGVKNTSLLETPPENRYPIQTYVLERNDAVIRDAIERELARQGQVFILHNRVSDIEMVGQKIKRLVPDARVDVAHGQMHKDELEQAMQSYVNHEFDVLVATTIIETGLDIPNANTLIILQADMLGLAQLYQIRGRVGRSDRIAYAYLMYQDSALTDEADKRLQAIKEFTELGSGFKIAMRDLSIRGAGDILGREQSGFIDAIGYDLYMQMLEEEISEQQGKVKDPISEKKQSSIKVQKHIPDSYTSDPETKIRIHRQIGELTNLQEVETLTAMLVDQFGYVPDELNDFMHKTLFDQFVAMIHVDQITELTNSTKLRVEREFSEQLYAEDIVVSLPKDSPIQPMFRLNRWMFEMQPKPENHLELWNRFLEPLTKKLQESKE